MARSTEQSDALFDVLLDGSYGVPQEPAAEIPKDPWDIGEWAGDFDPDKFLTKDDKAMIIVQPTSVEVGDRAGHLINALSSIAESNQARGFVTAKDSQRHQEPIQNRYGSRTNDIANEKDYKGGEAKRFGRHEFFAASGLGYLATATELVGPEVVARRVMDGRWASFQQTYGKAGAEARKQRKQFANQLQAQIDTQTKAGAKA